MYKLPKGVDLGLLVGKQLLQICIGSADIMLNFDDNTRITVMTAIHYERYDGRKGVSEDGGEIVAALHECLGCQIVDFSASEEGTLRLVLSSGATIEVRDDDPHHECYWIRHHESQIIV